MSKINIEYDEDDEEIDEEDMNEDDEEIDEEDMEEQENMFKEHKEALKHKTDRQLMEEISTKMLSLELEIKSMRNDLIDMYNLLLEEEEDEEEFD